MRLGFQTSEEWEARRVTCSHCNDSMQERSLPHHLATLHGVYQQTVVAGELLDKRVSVTYTAEQPSLSGSLFSGQSERQEGGAELPAMYLLRDANESNGTRALEDGKLLDRSR